MRIVVVGAGAIGSAIGGFLARACHDVTLLGRAWHLDKVRQEGLRITGIWGEHEIKNLSVATESGQISRERPIDWLLLCVKTYQLSGALDAVQRLLDHETMVCGFQNGLGNYEIIVSRIDPAQVALGRVIFGAELAPAHVHISVCADDVLIGAPDGRVLRDRTEGLISALGSSGVPCRGSRSILTAVWAKALYNCSLNALSALLEVPYGKLLEREETRRVMRLVIEEAYRVADGCRIQLEPSSPAAYIELLFGELIPRTAAHRPSMLQDLNRGRVTEVDALNGAIVRMGEQAGIEVPINALLTRLVHAKERFVSALDSVSVPSRRQM